MKRKREMSGEKNWRRLEMCINVDEQTSTKAIRMLPLLKPE